MRTCPASRSRRWSPAGANVRASICEPESSLQQALQFHGALCAQGCLPQSSPVGLRSTVDAIHFGRRHAALGAEGVLIHPLLARTMHASVYQTAPTASAALGIADPVAEHALHFLGAVRAERPISEKFCARSTSAVKLVHVIGQHPALVARAGRFRNDRRLVHRLMNRVLSPLRGEDKHVLQVQQLRLTDRRHMLQCVLHVFRALIVAAAVFGRSLVDRHARLTAVGMPARAVSP